MESEASTVRIKSKNKSIQDSSTEGNPVGDELGGNKSPLRDEDSFIHPLHFVSTVLQAPEQVSCASPGPATPGQPVSVHIKMEPQEEEDINPARVVAPEFVTVKAEVSESPPPQVKKETTEESPGSAIFIKIEPIDHGDSSDASEILPDSGADGPSFPLAVKKETAHPPLILDNAPFNGYIDHRKNTKKKLCELKEKPKIPPNTRPLNRDLRPFVCLECGNHFVRSADLNVHYRTHTGYRPFECSLCGQKFTQKGNLTRHTRTHTGDKPYECDTCGMRFAQKNLLKMHFRTHTGDRPFQCKECGQSFTTKSLVVTHYRTHTGERPYICPQCGRGFAQKHTLHCHMRVHSGDKPYTCEVCNKTFRFKNVYRIHKRSHLPERTFPCPTCGKSFKLNETLKKHVKTHLGHKPFSCECGKHFTQKYSLRYHVTSRLCPLNEKKKGKATRKKRNSKKTDKATIVKEIPVNETVNTNQNSLYTNGNCSTDGANDTELIISDRLTERDALKNMETVASFLNYIDDHMGRMISATASSYGLGFQSHQS